MTTTGWKIPEGTWYAKPDYLFQVTSRALLPGNYRSASGLVRAQDTAKAKGLWIEATVRHQVRSGVGRAGKTLTPVEVDVLQLFLLPSNVATDCLENGVLIVDDGSH